MSMLAGSATYADPDHAPYVACDQEVDDIDPNGRFVFHSAAIPGACGRCGEPIGVGEKQTVAGGTVVDALCADALEIERGIPSDG